MAKYKRKPITIEAFQWTGVYDQKTSPAWFEKAMLLEGGEVGAARIVNGDIVKMVSESGILTAYRSDYIIRGPEGELYPCKKEVFHLLHDAE